MKVTLLYLCIVFISFLIPIGYGFFQKKPEITFLDRNHCAILKGIAIIFVVVCHFMGGFGNGITWFTPLGGIGVSIFLLLSGYGLTLSWKIGGGTGYWRKRIITVFIPYTIFEVVSHWLFTDFDLLAFVMDITCIKPLYINGWYLQCLLGWYIVFWIVMKVPFLHKHKFSILMVVSVVVFFASYELAAEQALSFLIGVVLAEYKDNDKLRRFFSWKNAILLLIIGISALAFKQLDFVRTSPKLCMKAVQLLIKLPIGLFLVYASYRIGLRMPLNGMAIIGVGSFELYLIHGGVLEKVNISVLGALEFIVLTVIGTVLFWWIYQKQVEKHLKKIMKLE